MSATSVLDDEVPGDEVTLSVEEQKDRIQQEFWDALRDSGYLVADKNGGESKEPKAIYDAVFRIVSAAVVTEKSERKTKAVTRDELTAAVFPTITAPDATDYPDPIAQGVWKLAHGEIGRACNPDTLRGKVQQLVGARMGFVLCATTIAIHGGKDTAEAVYVTQDQACILADFVQPHKDKINRHANVFARNVGEVQRRLPGMSDAMSRALDRGMKDATSNARVAFTSLAVGDDDEGDSDDE